MTGLSIRGDLQIDKMTDKEKADLVFKAVTELKEAIRATTNGYMKTGALLSMIFENKLYRNYSSDVKTWEQFVAQTCPFKVAYSDHLRRVYCAFKDSIGDRSIPFNRLLEALPILTDDNMETILDDAETLPRKGWENQVAVAKGKMPSDVCLHEKTELWERCIEKDGCGRFIKKLGIEEKPLCKWTYDDSYEKWDTDCNNTFVLNDGTPEENDMRYCPYCGGILKVIIKKES